jgi:hypothetical protein
MARIFWRSPSSIRATGMPVQSATTRATCTGSTASSSKRSLPCTAQRASASATALRARQAAEADLGGLARSPPRSAAAASARPRRPRRGLAEGGDGAQLGLPLLAQGAKRARSSRTRAARRCRRSTRPDRVALERAQLHAQQALAPLERVDLVGVRIELEAQPAARLVEQIDAPCRAAPARPRTGAPA